MRRNIFKITVLSLFAATLVALPAVSRAEGAGANPPASSDQNAPAKSKKHEGLVFRGTVSAIDTNAMTLKVETRTFAITADTKIASDGKPATLADGKVGEPVSGAYTKADDGKLTATTIHFGAKPEKKKPEASGPGGDK